MTNSAAASYACDIPILEVSGLNTATFANLDTQALTNYINQEEAQNSAYYDAGHPQKLVGVVILDQNNNYNYGDLTGINLHSLSIDVSQFQHPLTVTNGSGSGLGSSDTGSGSPIGTDGNDTIYGTDGDDTLIGLKGDDYLAGGAGNDTYVYRLGDGNDTISAPGLSSPNSTTDTLQFTDLNASDLTFQQSGANLVVTTKANGQFITILNQFYPAGANILTTSLNGITNITFADGSAWNTDQIYNAVSLGSTGGSGTGGVPPTINGAVAGQTTTSEASIRPFSGVSIADANVGATETLTITVGGTGGTLTDGAGSSKLTAGGTAGNYMLSGTAAAVTSELDALVFTPSAGAPSTSSTTTFKLSDVNSAGTSVTNTVTTVINTDPDLVPTITITGTIAGQTTTADAPIRPFSGVTITDAAAGHTDTVYIGVGGAGQLADGPSCLVPG